MLHDPPSRTAPGTPIRAQQGHLLKEVLRVADESFCLRGTIRSPSTRTLCTLGIMECPWGVEMSEGPRLEVEGEPGIEEACVRDRGSLATRDRGIALS